MKKTFIYFIAAATFAGTACSSTDTVTDDTTADTAVTTDPTTSADITEETGGVTEAVDTETLDAATLTEMDDPTFMMTAASSNMLEVELGNMALQNSSDPKVKEFAQMMVNHHKQANEELKTIASELNTTLPQNLMPMHQAMVAKLSGKTGDEFNEAYMDIMETAHKMDVTMFEAKSNNATNPSVQAYAVKGLPILQTHHNMATEIEDTVD